MLPLQGGARRESVNWGCAMGGRRIVLHVINGNPLATPGLRSTLRPFPEVIFHDKMPASLASAVSGVVLVNEGALAGPVTEFLRAARLNHPKVPVIVLGAPRANGHLTDLFFLGAAGFVPYDRAEGELCHAIRFVARGRLWFATDVLTGANQRGDGALITGKSGEKLTGRETCILGLLGQGFCAKEIAANIGTGVSAVRFHLRNIYRKTGVHDRLRAIEWAKQNGFPAPAPGVTCSPLDGVQDKRGSLHTESGTKTFSLSEAFRAK